MTSPALAKDTRGPGRAAAPARAYADARDAVLTPRQGEYRLFARLTHRLSEAAGAIRDGDRTAYPRLAEAMHDNLRLWLTLSVDLAQEGNALPETLRGQLISLAGFVERQTNAILRQDVDVADAVQALVDVNAAIMKGLRGQPERE
ncbi:MAG: flagellar biosynthesis regulator FlaF [Pseudomonadota bacterium]